MSEKATVLVSEAKKVKEGSSDRGPWTLYHLIDGNEDRYSTFSDSLFNAAKGLEGKRVEVEYETTDKGKKLTAITEAVADNGDTPKLGTGEYKTGQKPIIEARRIFASTAWNCAAAAYSHCIRTDEGPGSAFDKLKKLADDIFLDLTRKGEAIEDRHIPFEGGSSDGPG